MLELFIIVLLLIVTNRVVGYISNATRISALTLYIWPRS